MKGRNCLEGSTLVRSGFHLQREKIVKNAGRIFRDLTKGLWVIYFFKTKLYRTRGLNPRVRPKGRAADSPLWKPHRSFDFAQDGELVEPLCARLMRQG